MSAPSSKSLSRDLETWAATQLQIETGATEAQIRSAYLRLALHENSAANLSAREAFLILTGRTNAEGKFTFEADRDGFWSAEATTAQQVARVMIRVGGDEQPQHRLSPLLLIGILAILLAVAIWRRLLGARGRRSRP